MAEHVHLFKPGQAVTLTASAAITGGELVAVSGSGTVAKTSAATVAWVGVAAHDAANGDRLTVLKGGVQKVTASGGITAGQQVVSAADGKVAALAAWAAASAADRQVVGVALTTATDGNPVEVDFVR